MIVQAFPTELHMSSGATISAMVRCDVFGRETEREAASANQVAPKALRIFPHLLVVFSAQLGLLTSIADLSLPATYALPACARALLETPAVLLLHTTLGTCVACDAPPTGPVQIIPHKLEA